MGYTADMQPLGGEADGEDTGAVAKAMTEPRSAAADGISTSSHSLPDLIAAEKYQAAKAAGRKSHRGLRFSKLVPPGTIGGQ